MSALDLSAKSSPARRNIEGLMDDQQDTVTKTPLYSATHGMQSHSRKRRATTPPNDLISTLPENDCSSSISSDGHDTDGSTNTGVKPIHITPIFQHPPGSISPPVPQTQTGAAMMSPEISMASTPRDSSTPNSLPLPVSTNTPTTTATSPGASVGPNRQFKMYPFDAQNVPNMYSQLAAAMSYGGMYNNPMAAAAVATAAAAGTASPIVPGVPGVPMSPLNTMNLPPMNVFDPPLPLSSTLGQYISQRKRRAEHRMQQQQTSTSQSAVSSSDVMEGSLSATSSVNSSINGTDSTADSSASKRHVSPDSRDNKEQRPNVQVPHNHAKKNDSGEKRDDSYWERRRKNNEAAKRSRDSRRAKEEEIAMRAAFLEQENLKLRAQINVLKNETTKLHWMLYNKI